MPSTRRSYLLQAEASSACAIVGVSDKAAARQAAISFMAFSLVVDQAILAAEGTVIPRFRGWPFVKMPCSGGGANHGALYSGKRG